MLNPWDLLDLARYLAAVALDGDYRNDWLTHLPAVLRGAAVHLAHLLYG